MRLVLSFLRGLLAIVALAWLLVVPKVQACESAKFEFLGEGTQAKDLRSGLIWQRCIIGQRWNSSTCINEDARAVVPGKLLTYREAMREALRQNERAPDPTVVWRVPTESEMRTLEMRACASAHGTFFDLAVFPTQTPWPTPSYLWFAGPFDLTRGVQIIRVQDAQLEWVGYGDQILHQLRLVR